MAQEYITQVYEEIEGRGTKELSKEFSRTESRILGALSKLGEFLLNPQVRIFSVAVPGTSRNSDSGNREPNGDFSPNDPCPEAMVSSHHSGNLNSSEVEEYPHRYQGSRREVRDLPYSIFPNTNLLWYVCDRLTEIITNWNSLQALLTKVWTTDSPFPNRRKIWFARTACNYCVQLSPSGSRDEEEVVRCFCEIT